MKPIDAIESAKSFCLGGKRNDKVKLGLLSEHVLLRELCWAVEIVLDNIPDNEPTNIKRTPATKTTDQKTTFEYSYEWNPKGYRLVLKALNRGELIARDCSSGTIIPLNAWSGNDEDAAFDAGFWGGVIERDEHCFGWAGHLPYITEKDAETWLKRLSPSKTSNRPRKQEEVAEIYHGIFGDSHTDKASTWAIALRRVNAEYDNRHEGQEVSLNTLKRALGRKK